jgi:transcriptional regulator with XRE-family HTH domain
MTEPQTEPRVQRQRLGAELRRLRVLAGMTGREVERLARISHPRLSRIENGEIAPTLPQLRAWAKVIGIKGDDLARLISMTEAAVNEVTTYRARTRGGLASIQEDIEQQEATTRVKRTFQTATIPGLLQTDEYAWHVLNLGFHVVYGKPRADIDEAVQIRMRRQAVLANPNRQFEFIMAESALRWRPSEMSPEVHRAQMERIIALMALKNLSIGVIPDDATVNTIIWCGFDIYDEREPGYPPFVVVELPHEVQPAYEQAEIDSYRRNLAALRNAAVFGDEASRLIRGISAEVGHS